MSIPDRRTMCCFTGHRTIYVQDRPTLRQRLNDAILTVAGEGAARFVCGGARGFDMMAGFAVLDMKQEHLDFRLVLVLPCANQDADWTTAERADYQWLRAAADLVTLVSDVYTKTCMKQRNQVMVDMSAHCISYLRHDRSGTSQTMHMAREKRLKIIEL